MFDENNSNGEYLENPLLAPIFDRVQQLVPCVHVSIYVVEDSDLTLVAYRGPVPAGRAALFSFPLQTAGGAHWVIQNASRLLISDAKGDSSIAQSFRRASQEVPENTFDYIGSWIGVPLILGGNVIGMLDLAHQQRDFYSDEDAFQVEAFVQEVSVNIENALLYARLNQRSAELTTLYAVQQAVGQQLEIEVVLQMVAEEAQRLTSAQQTFIILQQEGQLTTHTFSDARQIAPTTGDQVQMLKPLVDSAIESGTYLRLYDTKTDHRTRDRGFVKAGIRSLLLVPLVSRDRRLGVLVAVNKQFGAFSPNDERVLSMLASSAIVALENAELYHAEQKRRKTAEAIQSILVSLSSNDPIEQVLETAIRQACSHLSAKAGAVYLLEEAFKSATVATSCMLPALERDRTFKLINPPIDTWKRAQPILSHLDWTANSDSPALFSCLQEVGDDPDRALLNTPHLLEGSDKYVYALSLPLKIENALAGMIELYFDILPQIGNDDLMLAEDIGRHVALALERHQYSNQVEHLARLEERQRIAIALHDSVVQNLFRVGLDARWCLAYGKLEDEAKKRVGTMARLVNRSSYELRSAIFALRNRKLTGVHSLVELLQDQVDEFSERSRISAALVVSPGLPPISAPMAEAIFRIVREALTNVYRHSSASAAAVNLRWDGKLFTLTIQDNGIGFDFKPGTELDTEDLHFGLDTMDRLATQLDGSFFIGRNDDQGAMIRVVFPANTGEIL
ncbi:MAG: GAF domain-containing sensor histidine kinase [Anaerolineales bacterium]|nr:GAF domain-containing sensor histidine kinase [Anaerolineales bacterium]